MRRSGAIGAGRKQWPLASRSGLENLQAGRIRARSSPAAALLVAKLYKVWERREQPRRLENKDAADIFRLLQAIPTDKLITGLAKLRSDPISATVSAKALDFLQRLFGETEGLGIKLLRAAVEGLDDPDVAAASCLELAKDLIQAARILGL